MTVSNAATRNDYIATGGQTIFPYTFETFASNDLVVLQNGAILSEGSQYSISGIGLDAGGDITLLSGASASDSISIYLDMEFSRTTDYQNSGDFLASEVNDDFDRLWLATKQQQGATDRSLRLSDEDPTISMVLPKLEERKGATLQFDSITGEPKAVVPFLPSAASITVTRFSGTSFGQILFTLPFEPASENNTQVYVDGIYRQKDTYSLIGAILAFDAGSPPAEGTDNIEVTIMESLATGETSSNLVSHTPSGNDAVTTTVQSKLRETLSVLDFGAVGDGVVDDTASIQAAIDEAQGKPVYVPSGTYKITSTISMTSYGTGTFRQGCHLYGDGLGKTIFDNQVSSAPMFDLFASGTAGSHFSMGAQLSGFNVIRTTVKTAQVAIKMNASYMVQLEQIHINGMTGTGIYIPTILGDNDGSNTVTLNQVRIENCSGWGIDAVGSSGKNELSFVQMNQVFIQTCGTDSASATPPSGGMQWKGQILTMQQCAFTINENVALYVPGQAGLGQNVDLQSTTFENNNKRHVLVTGVKMFRGRNIQFYNNDALTATNGIEFEGSAYIISHVDLNGVLVRATSGNNAYTAFKISGAFADLGSCSVQNVAWDNFDYAGQVRHVGFKDKPTSLANKTSAQSVYSSESSIICNVAVSDIQDSYNGANGRYTAAYEAIWNLSGQLTITSLDAGADVVISLHDLNAASNIASLTYTASGNTTQSFIYNFTQKLGSLGTTRSYEVRAKQSSVSGSKALDVSLASNNTFSARRLPTGEVKF